MLKQLTLLSTVAAIGISTQAFAADILSTKVNINADSALVQGLPKVGAVTISGTVENIDGDKKFTLKDSSGDTIDVNTNEKVNVKKDSAVTVNGTLDSEILGMGREIKNATISASGSAGISASQNSDHGTDKKSKTDLVGQLPNTGMVEISGIVSEVNNTDNSFILKDKTGKTIDVNSSENIYVKVGDRVSVHGEIESNALCLGSEIQAERVIKM